MTLLCPAQAYPAPLFRWAFIISVRLRLTLHLRLGKNINPNPNVQFCKNLPVCIEPTSSTAPRFATDSAVSSYKKVTGRPMTLLCPAQAFPAPAFR